MFKTFTFVTDNFIVIIIIIIISLLIITRDNLLPRFCRALLYYKASYFTVVFFLFSFLHILHAFKYIYGEFMVNFCAVIFCFFNNFLNNFDFSYIYLSGRLLMLWSNVLLTRKPYSGIWCLIYLLHLSLIYFGYTNNSPRYECTCVFPCVCVYI